MAATATTSLVAQARRHLLETSQLITPAAPTVSVQGVSGATTYTYKVVALNSYGHSIASSAGSTTTGNAALSTSNFNRVTLTSVTGATGYQIYRTVGGGSTGLIATLAEGDTFVDDTGLTGDASTAPTTNTSGVPQPFWADQELLDLLDKGVKDLWGAILDLRAEHFITVDESNVTYTASSTSLTGVPSDCFRVYLIEPLDTTTAGSSRGIKFTPRDYNSDDFINARARSAIDTGGIDEVFYCVTNVGSPIGAPTVLVAPKITSTMSLRFVYNQTLTAGSTNPIPGESDFALIAWTVAYARAKEREDRSPDPAWIAVYGTEKQNLLARMAPRQEQEPDIVEDVFYGFGGVW